MTRRALVVTRPGVIGVIDLPTLEPGLGEVVIRPAFCGVCGTDLELLRGEVDPDYVRYPLTIGHEWSGTAQAVGAGVENVRPGDRCVAECIVPCGRCAFCRAGDTNICEIYDELGFTREGGASDEVLVPARLVHKLEPETSLLDAALVEPSSVVLRALEKAAPAAGDRVLVVGDGTIGLLAAYLVGLWSPASVTMIGRRAEQAELAKSVGCVGPPRREGGPARVASHWTDRRTGGGPDREQRPVGPGELRLHVRCLESYRRLVEPGTHQTGADRDAPLRAGGPRPGLCDPCSPRGQAGQDSPRDLERRMRRDTGVHQPPTHPLSRPYGSVSGGRSRRARRKSKSQPSLA